MFYYKNYTENTYFTCLLIVLTVTELIKPPSGKNELNKTIKSSARNLSQSMLQTANLRVISFVVSASLSNSPQLCSISCSSNYNMKCYKFCIKLLIYLCYIFNYVLPEASELSSSEELSVIKTPSPLA